MLIKKNISSYCVKNSDTIKEALLCLQKANFPNQKICIVIDKLKKVVGILTDGDIRRILIIKNDLNIKINNYIKNKKFEFVYENKLASEIPSIFKKKKDIFALPVLNKNRKLVGIKVKDVNLNLNFNKNEVFILAGGRGKRLFPLTDYNPKPLLKIGKLTMLESIMHSFLKYQFCNFTVSTNYLSKKIKVYFNKKSNEIKNARINFVEETKQLGTAGPLKLLKKFEKKKPIIVINGDIYTRLNFKNLLNFHERKKNDITICVTTFSNRVPYGVIERKNQSYYFREKPIFKHQISAGIYIINPKLITKIKKNEKLDMNDFINSQFLKGKKINLFPIHELWLDIGDHSSLIEAQKSIDNDW